MPEALNPEPQSLKCLPESPKLRPKPLSLVLVYVTYSFM